MTRPDEGDVPSFEAASEKYSMFSLVPKGDEGARPAVSKPSLGDRVERSDPGRRLPVERPLGDRGALVVVKRGDIGWKLGLRGEVAMGAKKGSTMGLVTAVCRAVRIRRGPAGLGTTMTSGNRNQGFPGLIMVWITSFTNLKLASDV